MAHFGEKIENHIGLIHRFIVTFTDLPSITPVKAATREVTKVSIISQLESYFLNRDFFSPFFQFLLLQLYPEKALSHTFGNSFQMYSIYFI